MARVRRIGSYPAAAREEPEAGSELSLWRSSDTRAAAVAALAHAFAVRSDGDSRRPIAGSVVRELSRRLSVAWRCAPGGQKLLAVTVVLVLLGGVALAFRGGSGPGQHPLAQAAATVDEPAPVVPTLPAASALPTSAPTTVAPPPTVSSPPPSASPTSGLETASAPDASAVRACTTFRTAVEPVIRQAVDNDNLGPASALVRAGSDPQSPWSQLTSDATLASMRAPSLQQHITLLGQDIQQADPSLSLTGLGSDLDAIDMDCGDAPG